MSISDKKIKLIEWLSRLQDERLLMQIDALRKGSSRELYESMIPKTEEELREKIRKSEEAIEAGRIYAQEDVLTYFKSKRQK